MIRRYLVGSTAARTGDEASGPALVLLGLAATGRATEAATLLAAATLTTALGGPLLGTLLDRAGRPGRLLAGALAGYAAGLCALAVLVGRLPIGWLVSIAAAAGLLGPALASGWSSRLAELPGLAGAGPMRRAYAADTGSFAASALAGPALAGAVAAGLGARWAMLVAAMLLLVAVPVALRLPTSRRTPTSTGCVFADLRRGLLALVVRRRLRTASTVSALSYLGIGAATVCVPVLGERLTGRAGIGAALLSVLAVGALLATAVLARWPLSVRPDVQVLVSAAVLAVGLLVVALAGGVPVVVAGLLLAGLADGPQLAALLAIRHREAPAGLRSQVFATGASLKQGGFALGAAVAGPLAGWSVRAGLLVAVAGPLAAVLVGALSHRQR